MASTETRPVADETWAPAPVEAVEAPVETIEAVEVVAEAENPVEADDAAEAENPVEANDAAVAEQETPMVAVMESDAAGETPEQTWDSGEAAAAEQSDEAVPVALQEEPVAEGAAEGSEGSEESEEAKEEEPVGAVVMPRSTGAGSWLRWPNSSGSDPDN